MDTKNKIPVLHVDNPLYKKKPEKFIIDQLNILRFECTNYKNGCIDSISYENLAIHNCKFEKV